MLKRIVAASAIAVAASLPAWAQDVRQPDELSGRAPTARPVFPDQQAETVPADDAQQNVQEAAALPTDQLALVQADTIKGSAVRMPGGDQIGKIHDVVVDMEDGQVAFAVVGVGGFLGVGEKNVAVPWARLQPGPQPQTFLLSVDRQTLQKAPPIDTENVAVLQQPETRQQIASFWENVPASGQTR